MPHFSHRLAVVRAGYPSTSCDDLAVAVVEAHLVPTGALLLLFKLCARQTPPVVETAVPFALLVLLRSVLEVSVGDVEPIAEAPHLVGTEGPIFADAAREERREVSDCACRKESVSLACPRTSNRSRPTSTKAADLSCGLVVVPWELLLLARPFRIISMLSRAAGGG